MPYIPQLPFELPSSIALVGSENTAGFATRGMDGEYTLQTSPLMLPPALGGSQGNQWYSSGFNAGIQRGIVQTGDSWTLYKSINTLDGSNAEPTGNAVQFWANNSPDPSVGPYLPKGTSPDSGFIRVRSPFIVLDQCGDPTFNGIYSYVADHTYTKGGVTTGDIPYIETNSFGDYSSVILKGSVGVYTGVYSQDNAANYYTGTDTDPASSTYTAVGSVNPQAPVAKNYISPQVIKGGSAASCHFVVSTPLPGITAPAAGCFNVWQGTNQTVPDTPLPPSGIPITISGVTYVFTLTGGSVTGATLQASLNALTLNFIGTQIFASGTNFTWSQFDIVRDPSTRTNLTGKPPLVMAHYVLSGREYGGGVASCEHEIQDAMAAGVDGFALNCGAWTLGDLYHQNAADMFQAAANLSPDGAFKLFWSFDGMPAPGIPSSAFLDMMQTYSVLPNYWKVRKETDLIDRAVISTYAGNGNGGDEPLIWNPLLAALDAVNIPYFFIPDFPVSNTGADTGTPAGVQDNLLKEWQDVDGMFVFAVGDGVKGACEAYAEGLDGSGRYFMSCLSPHYWAILNHVFMETHGYESLHDQVLSVVKFQKPDWVEVVTWQDIGENTHFSPIDDVAKYWNYPEASPDNYLGYMCCHTGYTRFLKHCIPWIKTGVEPTPTQDTLLYAYRKHAYSATASSAETNPKPTWTETGLPPADEIYVTTILTAPAQVTVTSGGTPASGTNNGVSFTVMAPAGISHYRTPFAAGVDIVPTFSLSRRGAALLSKVGAKISANPITYNLGYETGFIENLTPQMTTPDLFLNVGPPTANIANPSQFFVAGSQGYFYVSVSAIDAQTGAPVDPTAYPVQLAVVRTVGAAASDYLPGDWITFENQSYARLAAGPALPMAAGNYLMYVQVAGFEVCAPSLLPVLPGAGASGGAWGTPANGESAPSPAQQSQILTNLADLAAQIDDLTNQIGNLIMSHASSPSGLPPQRVYFDSSGVAGHTAPAASNQVPAAAAGVSSIHVFISPTAANQTLILPDLANVANNGQPLTVRVFVVAGAAFGLASVQGFTPSGGTKQTINGQSVFAPTDNTLIASATNDAENDFVATSATDWETA